MQSAETDDSAVSWLRGFLHAFESFNNKTNHGYTFAIDVFPKTGSVTEALQSHFASDLKKLSVTPIVDWPTFVRELFRGWLFQFSDSNPECLTDARGAFSLFRTEYREMLLNELLTRLQSAVDPIAVWKVEAETHRFYECDYVDVAFEEADRVIFLHIGVSD